MPLFRHSKMPKVKNHTRIGETKLRYENSTIVCIILYISRRAMYRTCACKHCAAYDSTLLRGIEHVLGGHFSCVKDPCARVVDSLLVGWWFGMHTRSLVADGIPLNTRNDKFVFLLHQPPSFPVCMSLRGVGATMHNNNAARRARQEHGPYFNRDVWRGVLAFWRP